MDLPRVYAISPGDVREAEQSGLAAAALTLLAGGHLVQIREKHWSAGAQRRFLALLADAAAPGMLRHLLVNTHWEAALSVDGAGVHLPEHSPPPAATRRELGPGRLLAVSCHDERRLAEAAE